MTRTENIRFKGTRQGVHLVIEPDASFSEVLVELDQRLKGADQFFRQASVMLNLGNREMERADYLALQDVLSRYGLLVVSAQASRMDTLALFRGLGVQTEMLEEGGIAVPGDSRVHTDTEDPFQPKAPAPVMGEAMVVHKTLRSGQTIHHPGDICLIGDVNPGAEIIAGDNVIVWGSLRGVVQAGTKGNAGAVVCALELAPTQLRIAALVTRQPEVAEAQIEPEMARIVDGQIVVEQWTSRARRARGR